ncbi:MAG: hypothetical protein E7323_04480 [Clostridiales bacterium]|nr:hypothetical protein [Clostridiales bacterium]
MKKKCLVLLCLLMILCMLPLGGMAIRYGSVVRITNGNAVNVRKGPGTGYGVLGEAQPQNLYVHLGSSGDWECILYQGEEGYVSASRVTVEEGLVPDQYGYGSYVDAIVRVTHGNALNVRKGPGKKYGSIGQAKPGTTWEYLGMDDGWNIIAYNDQVGYIAANRTEVEAVSSPTPTASSSDCEYCNGTGKLTILELNMKIECAFCDGTGKQ